MTEIVLFHHIQGLTDGVHAFADALRAGGHVVHVPDVFDGRTFDSIPDGQAHLGEVGFGAVVDRAVAAAAAYPDATVFAGLSLGVMAAQQLAQRRPGARAGLLLHSFVDPAEFGGWPSGVAAQVHGMDADPIFADEGDLAAARSFLAARPDAEIELFTYPGEAHLFTDSSLPAYDEAATRLVLDRVLGLLERL